MAGKRVAIMVSEGLHDWIKEEIERLETAHHEGHFSSPLLANIARRGNELGISIESFLCYLMEARQAHRMRRRKSRLSRKCAGGRKLPRKAPLPE